MSTTAGIPAPALKAHLALYVSDVGRSIAFYRKLFGVGPSKVRTGYAKFDVQNPPLNFTLNERPGAAGGALSHMGIQVASTEDVLAVRARWREAGLETRDEMQTSCCYAIQDKAWVSDPDGNEWEVFVVLQDNLAEATTCCVAGGSGLAAVGENADSSCCAPAAPVTLRRR